MSLAIVRFSATERGGITVPFATLQEREDRNPGEADSRESIAYHLASAGIKPEVLQPDSVYAITPILPTQPLGPQHSTTILTGSSARENGPAASATVEITRRREGTSLEQYGADGAVASAGPIKSFTIPGETGGFPLIDSMSMRDGADPLLFEFVAAIPEDHVEVLARLALSASM